MDDADLQKLFMPLITDSVTAVRKGKKLVHYTTAESAYRIIMGRQVWLRHVHLMNDYSEMRHGLTCLQRAWVSEAGGHLQQWLDENWPGLRGEVESLFNSHADGLTNQTYITSLSEHDDNEDNYGRLSMWRAYGGRAGVAIVLNTDAFLSDTDELKVFSTPVVYIDVPEYEKWFSDWVKNLIAATGALKSLDRSIIHNILFYALRMTVLATKHPGFREEREWRVFHSPIIEGKSEWISYEPEIIGGVPQPIVKLKLQDDEAAGVVGVDPAKLISRIIIGPCESPLPIRNAMWGALESVGVADPGERVWMSFIPLRHR